LRKEYDLPFLGQIPLVPKHSPKAATKGVPIMIPRRIGTSIKKAFLDFAELARSIAMLNANY